jgi:hypothetical protein
MLPAYSNLCDSIRFEVSQRLIACKISSLNPLVHHPLTLWALLMPFLRTRCDRFVDSTIHNPLLSNFPDQIAVRGNQTYDEANRRESFGIVVLYQCHRVTFSPTLMRLTESLLTAITRFFFFCHNV